MQLIPAVNNNSGAIQSIGKMLRNLNTLVRSHVILLSIIQKKLSITDEEITEEAERLIDEGKKRAEEMRLQSEEARTNEDGSGDEQSKLLDAESAGSDSSSSLSSKTNGDRRSVCTGESDASDPVVSVSESK